MLMKTLLPKWSFEILSRREDENLYGKNMFMLLLVYGRDCVVLNLCIQAWLLLFRVDQLVWMSWPPLE